MMSGTGRWQHLALAARWAAVLVAATVSLVLTGIQLGSGGTALFVASNALPRDHRQVAIGLLLLMGAAIFTGVLRYGARDPARTQRVERWGRIAAPLVLLWALPSLFARGAWPSELDLLIFLGLLVVCLEPLLHSSFGALEPRAQGIVSRLSERAPWVFDAAVVLLIAYYAIALSHYTVLNHARMATLTSDLGEFDNLFFNALHGHPFRAPAIDGDLRDWSALKVHAELVLYLALPFYAIRPGPEALLVIQSVVVAVTAVPIYLLARNRIGRPAGALVAAAFLFLPAVQRPNFYDFHFTPFGMLFASWTLYLADRAASSAPEPLTRRSIAALSTAFALTLLSREEFSLGLALVGAVLAGSGKRPVLGGVMAAAAAAYFVVVKFVVMPRFGSMWFSAIYEDLKAGGFDGYSAVVATLLTNPVFVVRQLFSAEKLLFLLHLTVPVAFLWLRRPWLLLAAIPGAFFTLLVTNRPFMSQVQFQYVYFWIPYVFAGAVFGLCVLRERSVVRGRAALACMALGTAASGYQLGALMGNDHVLGGFEAKRLVISAAETARLRRLRELVERIPPEASVGATEREGPHVSTRLVLYSLKYTLGAAPNYLLIGRVGVGREAQHVGDALRSGEYGIIATNGEFTLLQRGADAAANDRLIRRFGLR